MRRVGRIEIIVQRAVVLAQDLYANVALIKSLDTFLV
jgi:hypothetical protein